VLNAPTSEPRNSGRRHAQYRDGSAGAVTARSSGCATLVAMVQAGVLPAQDGQLMSQSEEFELQRGAATKAEQEKGTKGGQKREHAGDGMTAALKTLCFLGLLEF
ncbi:MAG: hypothetical protein WCG92_14810, partial [Hyphomicrobiales bacterium]